MNIGLRLLKQEFAAWDKIFYEANKAMCTDPNELSSIAMKEAQENMKGLQVAMEILEKGLAFDDFKEPAKPQK